MSVENANHASNNDGSSLVNVGGSQITIQQLQQIYSELTGKSESITNYYDDSIQIDSSHIEQLHHIVAQTMEQYSIKTWNCSFTIFYLKNTKDVFNSFDRFKLQSSSGASPVESVLIKYELMIILPQLNKPQRYTISFRAISRVAFEKRMQDDLSFATPTFLKMMAGSNASVEISYIDYSVARSFLSAFDDWVRTVPRSNENVLIKFLQKHSYWIPRIARSGTAIFTLIIIAELLPHYMRDKDLDLTSFGTFLIYSGTGIYFAYALAGWCADFAEYSIDRWSDLAFVKLNRADDILITASNSGGKLRLIKSVVGLIGSISVSVAAKAASSYISNHF